MRPIAFIPLLALTLLIGLDAHATSIPSDTTEADGDPHKWRASVTFGYDHLSGDIQSWQRLNATIQREFDTGTIVFQVGQEERFAIRDGTGQIDLWSELWDSAYGNVGISLAPDATIVPRNHAHAELFQVFGSWEITARYEWRRYVRDDLHMSSVQLGRYVGSWFLSTRTTVTPRAGEIGIVQRVDARRFLGSAMSYVNVQAGVGRGVEMIGPADLRITQTFFGVVRLHQFVSDHIGLLLLASYSDEDFYQRTGLTGGLLFRW